MRTLNTSSLFDKYKLKDAMLLRTRKMIRKSFRSEHPNHVRKDVMYCHLLKGMSGEFQILGFGGMVAQWLALLPHSMNILPSTVQRHAT